MSKKRFKAISLEEIVGRLNSVNEAHRRKLAEAMRDSLSIREEHKPFSAKDLANLHDVEIRILAQHDILLTRNTAFCYLLSENFKRGYWAFIKDFSGANYKSEFRRAPSMLGNRLVVTFAELWSLIGMPFSPKLPKRLLEMIQE